MQIVAVAPEIAFAQAKWNALDAKQRAARILAAMHSKKSSKSDLAERLDVSFQTINSWAVGDNAADWSRWMSICMALGVAETWEPTEAALEKAIKEVDAIRPNGAKPRRRPKAH